MNDMKPRNCEELLTACLEQTYRSFKPGSQNNAGGVRSQLFDVWQMCCGRCEQCDQMLE